MAHLRRDPRGYPVPVVVPWADGRPQFAAMSVARTTVVAHHRLCGVCGLGLEPGELYWRADDADNADIVEMAVAEGIDLIGSRSPEAGGHRECLTYAAMACPYLSADTARRRDATSGGQLRPKGELRGAEALLVGHADYTYEFTSDYIGFHLGAAREVLRYRSGHDLVDELVAAIAAAPERIANPDAPTLWDPALGERDIERLAVTIARGGRPQARSAKVGRNEPCPCGSGAKSKRCCHS